MSREGSLSCHSCCDTGPRFLRSHPKDPFKVDQHLVLNGVNRNVSAVMVDQHLVPYGVNRNVSAIKSTNTWCLKASILMFWLLK